MRNQIMGRRVDVRENLNDKSGSEGFKVVWTCEAYEGGAED